MPPPTCIAGLKEAVDAAGVDLVLACGPMMKLLFDDLKPAQQGVVGARLRRNSPRYFSTPCAPAMR